MPAELRRVTPEDILPDAVYAAERKARRAAMIPLKQLRRISLGPWCTFHFECFETMLFQIQEMLLVEKGGAAQLADEMEAYNPLIPQGSELVATAMFEIDDEVRRAKVLGELGGVEDCFFVQVGAAKFTGVPEGDVERTREDGKTSSVHFLHFPLDAAAKAAFGDPAVQVVLGCGHPHYGHMAILSPETRAELAKDLI
ncbi:MAG: DUF3501 family protein [Caulobacteraceae bacterium]